MFFDVGERHAGTLELVDVGVGRQVIVDAVGVVHTMAGEEQHAHVPGGHLLLQPVETVHDLVARGLVVGQEFHLDVAIERTFLLHKRVGEVLGILGREPQPVIGIVVFANARPARRA